MEGRGAEHGVPVVLTLLPARVWVDLHRFFCIPVGCGCFSRLPAAGSCRARGLEVFARWRGETEARGLLMEAVRESL